jgi:hypothetical protein
VTPVQRIRMPVALAALAAALAAGAAPAQEMVDTVRVRSRKLTIEEILARCVQGERSKLAGHQDMTYTMTVRTVAFWEKKKEVNDKVYRIFADDRGFSRAVEIGAVTRRYERRDGDWVLDEDPEQDMPFRIESDGFSDFAELPFFLEMQQEFVFTLLERTVEEDHVIFKIAFAPKSEFKMLPEGTVYVDTDAYRIVHEEFALRQNPFPLLLKDVKSISRHWEELPGGEWVFTRILMEVELRDIFFGRAPQRVAVALLREDFRFDTGYDPRLFGER